MHIIIVTAIFWPTFQTYTCICIIGVSTIVFSGVVATLSTLLFAVTIVAIAMTIAAMHGHYYTKDRLRNKSAITEAEYEMVDTATQKQPPLQTVLGPSARQATATSQSSGQSAPADPEYEVVDNKQKQTSSSDILLAENDAYVTAHFTAARQQ